MSFGIGGANTGATGEAGGTIDPTTGAATPGNRGQAGHGRQRAADGNEHDHRSLVPQTAHRQPANRTDRFKS